MQQTAAASHVWPSWAMADGWAGSHMQGARPEDVQAMQCSHQHAPRAWCTPSRCGAGAGGCMHACMQLVDYGTTAGGDALTSSFPTNDDCCSEYLGFLSCLQSPPLPPPPPPPPPPRWRFCSTRQTVRQPPPRAGQPAPIIVALHKRRRLHSTLFMLPTQLKGGMHVHTCPLPMDMHFLGYPWL